MKDLDLSKFKKLGTSKSHTTFKHPDGHVIHIVHDKLAPKLKEDLRHLKHARTTPNMQKFAYGTEEPVKAAPEQSLGGEQVEAQGPNMQAGDPDVPSARGIFGALPNHPYAEQTPPGPQNYQLDQTGTAQPGQGDPFGTQAYTTTYNKGLAQEQTGIAQEAAAKGALGREQAGVSQQGIQDIQSVEAANQQLKAKYSQDHQHFMEDAAAGHIKPENYLGSKDTLGKLSTVIGLIIGGLGGSDAPVEFLKNQIDRDIDAQKANLSNKQTLLRANMEHYKDLHTSLAMTKANMLDLSAMKLQQSAQKAQTPLAQAASMQAAGKLNREAAAIISQNAARQSILQGAKNGQVSPEAVVNFIVPEHQRKEANEELKTAQEMTSLKANALQAFDKVDKMTLGGALSPAQRDALVGPIVADISKRTAGRFTEQDAKLLEKLFPGKGSVQTTARPIQRAQLEKLFTDRMKFPILKLYGVLPQSSSVAPNPNTSSRYKR